MIKNLRLYGMVVITTFISAYVAGEIIGIACSNAFFMIVGSLVIVIPALIIGFILFLLLQRTSLVKFVNGRNITIVCIIIVILFIAPAINYTITTLPPSELLYYWNCDEGQSINDSVLWLNYDDTYAEKGGMLLHENISYEIEWDYDSNSNELIIWNERFEQWDVKLKIEFIKSNIIKTHYISNNSAPFNAELFDGIIWMRYKI